MGRNLDPLYVIGFEGFWGICIFGIILPIFQQIECTGQLCHGGRLEDTAAALQDFKNHPILIAQSLTNLFTIAGFNVTGVMITKYASAAQRSTVDTSRTLVIWIVFIFMGTEHFLVGELAGFVLLVLGTLVYNEIIEVPFAYMNQNTKANIEKREKAANALLMKKADLEGESITTGETQNSKKNKMV